MLTRRMQRRHRLLSAYMRVELEDRGVLSGDERDQPQSEPTDELPQAAESGADTAKGAREDQPA